MGLCFVVGVYRAYKDSELGAHSRGMDLKVAPCGSCPRAPQDIAPQRS